MRGCICHFVKWQMRPFMSKGTDYLHANTLYFTQQSPVHTLNQCWRNGGPPSTIRGWGNFHTWEYWGCAAGQGAFLSFQLWHRVSFLSFRNWDRVFFWYSNSGHPLSMYFADFSGHYQRNSITFLIASKCYKQILSLRSFKKTMKHEIYW